MTATELASELSCFFKNSDTVKKNRVVSVNFPSWSTLPFVYTCQFGHAGHGLTLHGLVQSNWFRASFVNFRLPHIFKHQIQTKKKTLSCVQVNTVSEI